MTSTEGLLNAPAQWARELRTLPVDRLDLCYDPRHLQLPAGRSLADVADDLQRGAWLARSRRSREAREEFRLGGTEFELGIRCRPAKGEEFRIAHVFAVDEARTVPRKAGRLAPAVVRFVELWDPVACDLIAVAADLARRLGATRDRGGRIGRQVEVQEHGELHSLARREYGDLKTLLGLLEQRPTPLEVTVTGVVADDPGRARRPTVVVDCDGAGPAEFRGKRVRLTAQDGRWFHTKVSRVGEQQLRIDEPRDWPGKPGELVQVAVVPPFGLRRNAEALTAFLDGDVEGSWHDLARLVCRPQDLVVPADLPALPAFFCDSDPAAHPLDDEQRAAVTGAVSSPHAFLIQGPPGTGKTEVIAEIVQQLTGRGERVLLLAPAHVAVDEVLGRVGAKAGIRPLRITFSDDKVGADVLRYLPHNVGVELADRVLRPSAAGQVERWGQELAVVEQRLAVVAAARDAAARLAAATADARTAADAVLVAAERRTVHDRDAERAVAALRIDVAAAEEREAQARAEYGPRSAAMAERLRTWQPRIAATRSAAGDLAAAAATEAAAGRALAEDEAALRRWRADHESRLARHEDHLRMLGPALEQVRAGSAAADTAADAAADAARQAEVPQGSWRRFAAGLGLGEAASRQRALTLARREAEFRRHELATITARWHEAQTVKAQWAQEAEAGDHRLRARRAYQQAVVSQATANRAVALGHLLAQLAGYGAAVEPSAVTGDGRAVAERCQWFAATVVQLVDTARSSSGAAPAPQDLPRALDPFAVHLRDARRADAELEGLTRHFSVVTAAADQQRAAWRALNADVDATAARLAADHAAAEGSLVAAHAEVDRLTAERDARTRSVRGLGLSGTEAELSGLRRRRYVLRHLPDLERRWRELVSEHDDAQLTQDIQDAALKATNLVCATTTGIVARGSRPVRDTDYDTLIVDEASRVTESEFLIGAVKARRWVLVGDEHQLPPHVDQEDEHFLHALLALHRHERGASATPAAAVDELAAIWREDEELREFRTESVREQVAQIAADELWESTFKVRMAEAHQRFRGGSSDSGPDPDRALLQALVRYLVRSLFERAVRDCAPGLRQPLVWQRRMIGPLAEIVNQPVYAGDYRSPPAAAATAVRPLVLSRTFVQPAVFVDTSGYGARAEDRKVDHGFENELEQQLVLTACEIYNDELSRMGAPPVTTSVLSFYKAQARALEKKLDRCHLPMLDLRKVDVVDRIQGQQADLVLVSFVRARRGGQVGPAFGTWLQDVRRLNVACTRARRALVLVGHADTLRRLGTTRGGQPRDQRAEPAVAFYRNLFGLFDGAAPEFIRVLRL